MNIDITLCSHDECTGCMACVGVCAKGAIYIEKDSEGFSHPVINRDICIGCHLCQKTCPVINPIPKNSKGKVYAAWSTSDSVRQKSSSGGLFSELAISIIDAGGLIVGAAMNDKGFVFHCVIDSVSELNSLRGSKYVQSNILSETLHCIKEALKNNRKVLFTGTPCQVAGIRKLFKDDKNLFTMDLVCHGVPSPDFFSKIYCDIKLDYPNIVSYNFRKLDSWAVCSSVNININNNILNRPLYGKYTLYQDAFLKGYLHRPNCYKCQYACVERVGDVTVADFWGIGTYKPINEDYRKGCSMLSVNSQKGKYLFESMHERIYCEERDIQETIDGGNEQLQKSSERPSQRDSFYVDAKELSYTELIKKYELDIIKKPSIIRKCLSKIHHKIKRIKCEIRKSL